MMKAVAGRTGSEASMRSKKPPWPGKEVRRVLDSDKALEHRLPEVAGNRERNEHREHADAPQEARIVEKVVREDVLSRRRRRT